MLLRAMLGGVHDFEFVDHAEGDLVRIVREDLRLAMGIEAEPIEARVVKWPHAIPQYDLGHADRVAAVEALRAGCPGLHLAGASWRGVSVNDCLADGLAAARAVIA